MRVSAAAAALLRARSLWYRSALCNPVSAIRTFARAWAREEYAGVFKEFLIEHLGHRPEFQCELPNVPSLLRSSPVQCAGCAARGCCPGAWLHYAHDAPV